MHKTHSDTQRLTETHSAAQLNQALRCWCGTIENKHTRANACSGCDLLSKTGEDVYDVRYEVFKRCACACRAHLRNIWAPHANTRTTGESRFFSHGACAMRSRRFERACVPMGVNACCRTLSTAKCDHTGRCMCDAAADDVRGNTGHVRVRASKSGVVKKKRAHMWDWVCASICRRVLPYGCRCCVSYWILHLGV